MDVNSFLHPFRCRRGRT